MTHANSKRERFARVAATVGLTQLVEALPKRSILMGLTYHRIGASDRAGYDTGVYSATEEEFDAQLAHLKQHYNVLTPAEVVDMATGHAPPRSGVVITFDDGYVDNYEVAFPVLRKHGLSAIFFLTTAYVGSGYVPWWDRIAYMVRSTKQRVIRLSYPHQVQFDIGRLGRDRARLQILRLFRNEATTDPQRFERELQQACEIECPSEIATPRFLNWDQAREMLRAGMSFGSHTNSHPILAKLSADEQFAEVQTSRDILQRELQVPIDVFAYPVGSRHSFSDVTVNALKHTGYRAAFSHYGGGNRLSELDAFDIRRESIGGVSHHRFRLQTALSASTGALWF